MNCEAFRKMIEGGIPVEGPARSHLRACSACLEAAVAVDPENLFRSIGGDELTPPGGVDLFVRSVVDQVHVREAEKRLAPSSPVAPWTRWAIAATLAAGLISSTLLYRPVSEPVSVASAPVAPIAAPSVTRPVVESYDNANATIVELASANDLQVVMVFDDSLPADL